MTQNSIVRIDRHPGRSAQTIGMARELGTDPDLVHEPSVGVVGTKGDSQCYLGVQAKVDAIHATLRSRIGKAAGQLPLRLVQPEYTIATSDGIRNGTREMRYSLIGREVTNDSLCEHLSATGLAGTIAVVACDKPPVGTLAALLEHNQPAIIMSDGPIHPGHDPNTGETLDIVSAYQVAGHPDPEYRHHIACHACPGSGSCGGMFTYNTMQTFIGVVGMQPLHMVAPASEDPRRLDQFPAELVGHLAAMIEADLRPRDIVVRDSLRNAMIVVALLGAATGIAERDCAVEVLARLPASKRRRTIAADKAYDTRDFVARTRGLGFTPHVAQNTTNRRSAIDGRTTRHAGHVVSQRIRKRVEEPFGWIKTIGGGHKLRYIGRQRNRAWFKMNAAIYNLIRITALDAQPA